MTNAGVHCRDGHAENFVTSVCFKYKSFKIDLVSIDTEKIGLDSGTRIVLQKKREKTRPLLNSA